MTCIVGIKHNNHVYLGGDAAGVGGLSIQTRRDVKVFRRGQFLLGFTSSFRMGQVLRYKLSVQQQPEGMDDYEFMVTLFVDAVRDCFKSSGFATKKEEVESGGTFLVGYRGELYEIQSDYQVAMLDTQYAAVGCGDDLALGSLYSSEILMPELKPEERLRLALEAATKFSAGVSAPYTFVNTEDQY